MKLPLIITQEAEEDILFSAVWYDQQREHLGDEFIRCLEGAFIRIQRNPESFAEVFPSVRRALVRRFPYSVIYRLDSDQIGIIAVYHGSRDPKGWQERLA